MKTKLLAIAIFAVSIPAMATNPKPPEPDNPSSSAASSSVSGDSKAIANGGDSTASQKQGQSFNSDISNSLGNISPTASSDSINHLKGGEVLAAGVTTGSNSYSGGGGGGAGGHATGGNANQRQAIKDSANNSFNYQSYDTNIERSGLVQGDCWGSADLARGRGVNVLGVGWTFKDGSCIALRNAKGLLDIFPNKQIMAYEVLCGNKKFRSADARSDRQCHANQDNKTASNHQARELVAGR